MANTCDVRHLSQQRVPRVKILRLTNSNDVASHLPASQLSAAIADETIARLTGERPETTVRVIWPGPELPSIVRGWLERYDPDVVFLRSSSFWVCYESVPLRFQRRFGPVGRRVGALGLRVGGHPSVSSHPLARNIRQYAVRTIGGDTYFTPAEATAHVEATLRTILAAESMVPALRGPSHVLNSARNHAGYLRAYERILDFERRLATLCTSLHVSYVSARGPAADSESFLPDQTHDDLPTQRIFGELEGRAIAEAWRAAVAAP